MVVKMMKWRPWPPLLSKRFEVKLIVHRLEGFHLVQEEGENPPEVPKLMVEIKWKGPKIALSSLRRSVKKNFTEEDEVRNDGVVEWNEEFQSVLNLSAYKENVFHPWEIAFTVLNGLNQGSKSKVPVVGTALLNIAEVACAIEDKELEVSIPLTLSSGAGGAEPHPTLCLSISLLELRTAQEPLDTVQRSIVPISPSPRSREALPMEKEELSAIKAGLRKVKILTEYVSTQSAKKACHEEEGSEGRFSARSEDADNTYPSDMDSLDDLDEGQSEEGKEDSGVRKSFSYGTLAYANCAGGSFYSGMRINGEDEDWVYSSNRKSDMGCLHVEDSTASVSEQTVLQSSKRSILSWRKRKLGFRSPKTKGEPLLKKAYGEEGGDDIDFDRRQLSSSDESFATRRHKTDEDSSANRSSVSEFGDDNFTVGSWEHKEVISRDGVMKLQTTVFFASIDQRSERAAGESACTALVAVIADWFQTNQDALPIKSQFDSLIREGSLEWRNLCKNETYRERFPDKHFDLETVLQAKIRPLSVVPDKSFIGFFHPDGMDEASFDFLHSAMSFDSIWDEISRSRSDSPSNSDPQVYIVSWNDHFFVLKVEPDAYYIIDTLGERLYEGCNQAYILKFDRNTTILRLPNEAQALAETPPTSVESRNQQNISKETTVAGPVVTKPEESENSEGEVVVCRGKESCKEYINGFLAAIPIRELQVDMKKGLMSSTPLHHRLQIEFHYSQLLQPVAEPLAAEATAAIPGIMAVADGAFYQEDSLQPGRLSSSFTCVLHGSLQSQAKFSFDTPPSGQSCLSICIARSGYSLFLMESHYWHKDGALVPALALIFIIALFVDVSIPSESHPTATQFCSRSISEYDNLAIIIGNDQAMVVVVVRLLELMQNLRMAMPLQQGISTRSWGLGLGMFVKKKLIAEAIRDATSVIATYRLLTELDKIPDFDKRLVIEAVEYLSSDMKKANLLFAVNEDYWRTWLLMRLRDC
ncbi:hypothetical protein HHK36_011494 [Tetracentron sinense]|uniref:C2 NT-type domain-containing protein n=1 Tax=Tetracentron sinense TaxID=13715 RepID=A0A834ZB77_TETSI|nr:hypothetical protein HHK36_011494 [Tetracentron sinense]